MIRPTVVGDTPFLLALTKETGVFKPLEVTALEHVLRDYHASEQSLGHRALTCEVNSRVAGFAYYAPDEMTDRTWHLWWIAVRKGEQARGLGSILLGHVETDIRHQNGRLLLIETSALPHYELTRRFYRKHGYEQHAVLKDFYADGDDMVIFRKRLTS